MNNDGRVENNQRSLICFDPVFLRDVGAPHATPSPPRSSSCHPNVHTKRKTTGFHWRCRQVDCRDDEVAPRGGSGCFQWPKPRGYLQPFDVTHAVDKGAHEADLSDAYVRHLRRIPELPNIVTPAAGASSPANKLGKYCCNFFL